MDIYNFGKELIVEAGKFIEMRMTQEFEVDSKSNPNDLVTDVDRETEQFLYTKILERFPDHLIIGEEGHGQNIKDTKGVIWIVDPIDGTLNFVHQGENFAISIGVFIDGEPYCGLIYDCMKRDLYHAKYKNGAYLNEHALLPAENIPLNQSLIAINPKRVLGEETRSPFFKIMAESRSVRSYGSAALEFAMLAKGQISALLFLKLYPWDYTAGVIITEELGFKTSDLYGRELPLLSSSSVISGNPKIHSEILEYFAGDKRLYEYHEKIHDS